MFEKIFSIFSFRERTSILLLLSYVIEGKRGLMDHFPDHAQLSNLVFIENLYKSYLEDPKSVDPSWVHFFEGIDFASFLSRKSPSASDGSFQIGNLIAAYRRCGHLMAAFNPLSSPKKDVAELNLEAFGFSEKDLTSSFPTLGVLSKPTATLQEILQKLQSVYASRIGFEYMDLGNLEMEDWIKNQIESASSFDLDEKRREKLLENLTKAELFESFLHTKYVGQKRFSLEGNETLIPLLSEMISQGAELGLNTFVLGMAHRGRLNVLANILQKPYPVLFREFDDNLTLLSGESGDVKYHKGYSSSLDGVDLYLASNSSCLESVDGIVLGATKAYQISKKDEEKSQVATILMHGDAAMTGQGIFYEILEMGRVRGFSTGGTIHIAINNQMGYTTSPEEGRSTLYCTDIAKTFGAPVFHVNAEDPESCVWAARLAIEIRQKFHCDVFIDLNGYRKYGHNEGDEPGYTQPVQYSLIRGRETIRQKYIENHSLHEIAATLESKWKGQFEEALQLAKKIEEIAPHERLGKHWLEFVQPDESTFFEPVETALEETTLKEIASAFCRIPENFNIHPKLKKLIEQRLAMVQGDPKQPVIDWAMGECLSVASLIWQGIPVRLAGQDSCRGTFSHRHAVWFDQQTAESYSPYLNLKPSQPRCDIYNTILSEFGSLGFELGYSWVDSKSLVCWEAQYGDFVIGAEILIDHYITAAEQKWARYSSLTLLLPHGYEGAGPEHSSARMERFLQLAVGQNIQVVNPTTSAQFFHLLRRQALRPIKKPLIVLSPKSLLRFEGCYSPLESFTSGFFEEVLDDPSPIENPKRILLCTGKIYYDLLAEKKDLGEVVLVRLEQIYPIHKEKLRQIFSKYPTAKEIVWVQEEPENMGAWEFLRTPLSELLPEKVSLQYVARPRSASTATGSLAVHKEELKNLLLRLKDKV